jgi:hypothetical protein
MQLNPAEIPSSISDYYTKHYPAERGYSIRRDIDNTGKATYFGTTGTGSTLYFDKDGNYVRTAKGGTGTK